MCVLGCGSVILWILSLNCPLRTSFLSFLPSFFFKYGHHALLPIFRLNNRSFDLQKHVFVLLANAPFCFSFGVGFLCGTGVLELSLRTRLALNSEIGSSSVFQVLEINVCTTMPSFYAGTLMTWNRI